MITKNIKSDYNKDKLTCINILKHKGSLSEHKEKANKLLEILNHVENGLLPEPEYREYLSLRTSLKAIGMKLNY